jgi:TonB family protein
MAFPAYPSGFLRRSARDSALVDAVVDVDGTIPLCSVRIRLITDTLLRPALLAALGRERWRPAHVDGKPVPLRLRSTSYFFSAIEAAQLEREPLPAMPSASPVPLPGAPAPAYPVSIEPARPGHVVLTFTVTLEGRVDIGSVRVVSSDDSAFTQAVLAVLPRWRYRTPILDGDGRPMAPVVQQEFFFTPLPRGRAPLVVRQSASVQSPWMVRRE